MDLPLYAAMVLSVLGIAGADTCCFPKQYEAVQGLLQSTMKGSSMSVMYGFLVYSFDAISRREVFSEHLTIDGVETVVTVLKDYNVTNTKYVIANGKCTHKSLTPFKEGCIPDWATKLTDGYYGVPDSGTKFTVYDNSASGVTSFLTATPGNSVGSCYPVLDASANPDAAQPYMRVVQLYNFTLGIKDESVFDIPTICQPTPTVTIG